MKRLATLSMLALTVSAAHAGRAVAAPDAELPSRVVKYSDLDLSQPAAVTALYGRIEFAARSVCDVNGGYGLANAARFRQCLGLQLDQSHAHSQMVEACDHAQLPESSAKI